MNNIVVISDIHAGCKLGLCPPEGLNLDEGGRYLPSEPQTKVWAMWEHFWNVWVPHVCHDEPYVIVFNGDAIDGVHHGAVTQITHNLTFQKQLAYNILAPQVTNKQCVGYYHIRGTEAHGGKSGAEEEALASWLGAMPNELGQFARYELWYQLGEALVHFAHHIGATGSAAYESTAVMRELVTAYTEAGRWHDQPPDVVVRGHRHRQSEVRVPTRLGYGISFTTPGWQLKTPLVFRMAQKLSQPQFGGSIIRMGDSDVYTRHKVWSLQRPKVETHNDD